MLTQEKFNETLMQSTREQASYLHYDFALSLISPFVLCWFLVDKHVE
jgi:hypothetical protein